MQAKEEEAKIRAQARAVELSAHLESKTFEEIASEAKWHSPFPKP